ncbi:hypothetical protein RchiOBHm_Chr5g0047731 [Rosa chinensis]|uniref:Uncharacterized protein n=1 Tax=Rosa chinensis TaxID=74649 RepID=A0A2P6QEG6_ROSCH|nr:hypothetical protein RchiOBHm_Chr5g0047731 [Rosa chinensis]
MIKLMSENFELLQVKLYAILGSLFVLMRNVFHREGLIYLVQSLITISSS